MPEIVAATANERHADAPILLRLFVQTVTAVPLFQGLVRELGKVPLVTVARDLAPRSRIVEHDAHLLRGLGERRVYRRGEGMDELRPAGVKEPQRAAAHLAEVPPGRADLG